jgi:hypothetical protein
VQKHGAFNNYVKLPEIMFYIFVLKIKMILKSFFMFSVNYCKFEERKERISIKKEANVKARVE